VEGGLVHTTQRRRGGGGWSGMGEREEVDMGPPRTVGPSCRERTH
jgi:hypothetical protein